MKRARARKSGRAERGGTLRFVLTVAILAWAFRSFAFAPFSIPSGSMLPTLYIGDYLAVAKWPYGFSSHSFPFDFPPFKGRVLSHLPERGDVVVFVPPGDEREDYVKRVIGLPGDTVEVRDGVVVLNGKPVRRDSEQPLAIPISANSPCRTVPGAEPVVRGEIAQRACIYRTYRETLPGGASYRVIDQVDNPVADDVPPTTVPAGHLFLMGDNRDDSLDSRFSIAEGGIGMVPVENVVGRASVIFWSTDGSSSYVKPWTWFTALRGHRLGHSLSPESK
ncbi:MAG: signal peptidase I [Sphingomicrobium sp.]